MNKILLCFLAIFFLINCLNAQVLITSVEAETGVLTGVNISPQAGSSSGPFVTGFDGDGDKVTVSVTVADAGNYRLEIRYRSIYGPKTQDVYVNNVFAAAVAFPMAADFVNLSAGSVQLNAGVNTITVQKSWGYMDVDKFSIYTIAPNVFNITQTLIDPQANQTVKGLYSFLLSQFGNKIISGSTDGFYENIKTLTGKSPLLRAWDFASYSPMYPYNWANGGFAFGAVDNQDAEKAINWYNATGKKGIVALHWHWGSPSGGTVGTNTFYTTNTVFDVSKAVINGTQENTDVLRDIDAIAVQLKKLRDADVPVLWRPLHEAGGAWFWWGAKGSGPAKALWDIMYNRLTNFHGLHNLIWVWSSPEADWYPGNSKVDIIGFDSYPGDFNYTTQKTVFDNLYTITTGNKLIAMSENGPIPDIDNALNLGAPWSYFMTWNDLAFSQNTNQHILDVYGNAKVITLENYTAALPVLLSDFTAVAAGTKSKIQWITATEQDNDRFEIERSVNGINYYKIATVQGMGNSSMAHRYTTFDNNPSRGTNYYRLVQFNFDGKRVDHGVRTVSFNKQFVPSVSVFPNPSKNIEGIFLNNYTGKSVAVTLTDMSGKQLHKQIISTNSSQGYYKLNTAHSLVCGQYILHISGDNLEQNVKLLVN
ncbi:hypothetical protein BH10BAC3_BH10BAC3_07080 [soil metagenome]